MINIQLDRRSRKVVNDLLKHQAKRVRKGEQLLLLELATVLWRALVLAGAKVPGRKNKPWSYAKKLRVAPIKRMGDLAAAVAVWLEEDPRELKQAELLRTALIIRPEVEAPPWVHVLADLGPLPADLLPATIPKTEAKIVSRRVRPDEAQRLRDRLLKQRRQIEAALRQAEAPVPTLASGTAAVGLRVYVDLAWEVLRAEFGLGDRGQDPHWRPAIQAMFAHVPVAMEHFGRYLLDGKAGWFDVRDDGAVGWRQVRTGVGFQAELMPFVKSAAKEIT